ncbi:IS30 family transposase [Myroides odoratimimus]|uniref:IS30 family transposase n=1 Tax=Myroides odoratimimus TaxID=76832 RepID=UPI002574D924|nr:IS30 family transposase [Myroides odoratimimus]MDM1084823.1 IS30 family transposase [Myroides odoratimimus]
MSHLTLEQRYKIEAYKKAGKSLTEIACYIGKDKSVVSRELKRNSNERNGVYKANLGQRKTAQRHKEKRKRIRLTENVKTTIIDYLNQDYSPEQIVGRSKIEAKEIVSVECIYQFIWQNKKQGGKLYKHLRTKGKKYRKRGTCKDSRGLISNRVDIEKRPSIVDDKYRIDDLEIDLVIGKNHRGALLTINDRATGVLWMGKIESKEAHVVEAKIIELLKDFKPLLHTMTSDNGKEFANHQNIANTLELDYYFAKPYHSWERGANENLNGLVRQYFPKMTNFDLITQAAIDKAVNILNNRPRKRFGFKSPNEIFTEKLNLMVTVAFNT